MHPGPAWSWLASSGPFAEEILLGHALPASPASFLHPGTWSRHGRQTGAARTRQSGVLPEFQPPVTQSSESQFRTSKGNPRLSRTLATISIPGTVNQPLCCLETPSLAPWGPGVVVALHPHPHLCKYLSMPCVPHRDRPDRISLSSKSVKEKT